MKPSVLKFWIGAFLLLGVYACLETTEDVSGTSVTAGNPTKVGFVFEKDGVPVKVTGSMVLFESRSIPVWDSTPRISTTLSAVDTFYLTSASLDSLLRKRPPDSLRAKPEDSTISFVLTFRTEDSLGAIVTGTKFNYKRNIFAPSTIEGRPQTVQMKHLVDFNVFIDPERLNPDKRYFLFLFGSDYYAKSDTGRFSFHSIPQGILSMASIAIPIEQTGARFDSIFIYGLKPLDTDKNDSIVVEGIIDTVPLCPAILVVKKDYPCPTP